MASISIDLFSDPACPWCLVGLARLDKAIAALPADIAVQVNHHPYLLDAQASETGEDVRAMLIRKYGNDPEPMWDRLEAEAASAGVTLDMRKQKLRYATQKAQALIAAAADKGTQHPLARAIGDAYYLEARNIADNQILVDIAQKFGFSAEEALAIVTDVATLQAIEQAAASASAQGIQGVPFFIFDQQFALSGAQPDTVFAQAFDKLLAAPIADA